MHLPNAVLLSAAIALASELEPLQVHALGNEEADAFVGRFLRSDTTSRARIEERGAFKMPSCLGCLPGTWSPAKLLAAGAAEKAEANTAKLAEANAPKLAEANAAKLADEDDAKGVQAKQVTDQALDDLVDLIDGMSDAQQGVDFFIRSKEYDLFRDTVREVNGKLPKGIMITPGRVLVRHFGYEKVRGAILRAMWSSAKQIKFRGNVLATHYNTEAENGRAI
uniref:Uncharacterized protein n=1 Tax=Peronospora matthiolae TaxID=2874970 RepID=A0AAV1TL70_9STRA